MILDRPAVSGANGFIGSQLVNHLSCLFEPERVFSLVRRNPSTSRQSIHCDFSNVRHIAQTLKRIRPTVLFHAAGGSKGTLEEMIAGNICTTLHLFQAIIEARLRVRVVILGSAAEYGMTRERCSASKTLLRPAIPYAWTKACQTLLAGQAAQTGLDVVIARLFNFTGPGLPSRFAVGSFAEQITKAERSANASITVGNLNACRDFLDVRDAAAAITRVAEKGISGKAYDVCSGYSQSMRKVLALLLRHTRKPITIRSRPTRHRSTGDIPFSLGDPGAVRRLGWKPTIPLETSLTDTLDYYRSKI